MTSAWPERSLGEFCTFKYGKALPSGSRSDEGFAVYGSNGPVGQHAMALTDGAAIVVGRKGSFGEVHYSSKPCWPIDTTYFIDRRSTDADLRWLMYGLRSLRLTDLNRAAAVPGLNREDAYRQRLLVPPIEEQRRITAVLDQADTVRAKRRSSLEFLDGLCESAVTAAAADSPSTSRLGEALMFVTSGARGWARYYAATGVRFVRSVDVRMNRISSDSSVFVQPPETAEARRITVRCRDVLLTITGSRIGRVAVAPDDLDGAFISQHVALLRIDDSVLLPEFVASYLGLRAGGQRQIASAQYGRKCSGA